jgi:hypothetical protein
MEASNASRRLETLISISAVNILSILWLVVTGYHYQASLVAESLAAASPGSVVSTGLSIAKLSPVDPGGACPR